MLASEMINILKNLIQQHGDKEIVKIINGDAKKIWNVDYSNIEKQFELL